MTHSMEAHHGSGVSKGRILLVPCILTLLIAGCTTPPVEDTEARLAILHISNLTPDAYEMQISIWDDDDSMFWPGGGEQLDFLPGHTYATDDWHRGAIRQPEAGLGPKTGSSYSLMIQAFDPDDLEGSESELRGVFKLAIPNHGNVWLALQEASDAGWVCGYGSPDDAENVAMLPPCEIDAESPLYRG